MLTKADRIKEYNRVNPDYNITNIKAMRADNLGWSGSNTSLFELYDKPSDEKIEIWEELLETYKPSRIYSVQGSGWAFSVVMRADNGDVLHITKGNNYLIDVV